MSRAQIKLDNLEETYRAKTVNFRFDLSRKRVEASGDTYPVRKTLQLCGFSWDKKQRVYVASCADDDAFYTLIKKRVLKGLGDRAMSYSFDLLTESRRQQLVANYVAYVGVGGNLPWCTSAVCACCNSEVFLQGPPAYYSSGDSITGCRGCGRSFIE